MSDYSVTAYSEDGGVVAFAEGRGTKAEVLAFVAGLPAWLADQRKWDGANIRLTLGRKRAGANVTSITDLQDFVRTATKGEKTMTDRNDVTTEAGTKVIEQIDANIERAASLVEADNVDGLKELSDETEALISSLSGKGSIAVKKAKRDAFMQAATAQPKGEIKKVHEGKVMEKTWEDNPAVVALVDEAATTYREGVKLHLKGSHIAKSVARTTIEAWVRIQTKDGIPDLWGNTDDAKSIVKGILNKAGEGMEENDETRAALDAFRKQIAWHRGDARAQFLRDLDKNESDRELFAKVLEGKPEDTPASEWVAQQYNASLVGHTAKKRQPLALETAPSAVRKIKNEIKKIEALNLDSADDATKEAMKDDLAELLDQVKKLVAAVL